MSRGFFSRLFGKDEPSCKPADPPDDTPLRNELGEASEKHKKATLEVKQASIRQMTEGEHIRTTLNNVLRHIEERKHGSDH
jgi:hypothetical protein